VRDDKLKIGRNILQLSDKWIDFLISRPETGMGYQICTIVLNNGMQYKQAVIDSGFITKIKDIDGIPFSEDDIAEIVITHEKWKW
jgi:hypothetical protein